MSQEPLAIQASHFSNDRTISSLVSPHCGRTGDSAQNLARLVAPAADAVAPDRSLDSHWAAQHWHLRGTASENGKI